MTQPIENSTTAPTQLFTALSRYLNSTVILYGEKRKMTLTTYKRNNFVAEGDEKTMLINKGVEYRPDLVAFDVYGVSEVWWKILEANRMSDVFDFKAGLTITLPKIF
jgi:hypothetical protein